MRQYERCVGFAVALGLGLGSAAQAQPPAISTDTTVTLGTQVVTDEDTADDLTGTPALGDLGPLPGTADVTAFHPQANGDTLFALDTTVDLDGTVYLPGDIIRWDGVAHSLFFDAGAAGLPMGVIADALSIASNGDVLLSFDTTVEVASGIVAADEDVVRYAGTTPSLEIDGSAQGIADALDIDGFHDLAGGSFAVSFDTAGTVGSIDFDDDDIVRYDAGSAMWLLHFDGSAAHAALGPADVDAIAVPEPAAWLNWAFGLPALLLLARRRWTGPRDLP